MDKQKPKIDTFIQELMGWDTRMPLRRSKSGEFVVSNSHVINQKIEEALQSPLYGFNCSGKIVEHKIVEHRPSRTAR